MSNPRRCPTCNHRPGLRIVAATKSAGPANRRQVGLVKKAPCTHECHEAAA